METIALLGSVMGLGFVAGFRLYAAVLTVGLGVKCGLIKLDPALSQLAILTHPMILTTAGILYVFEFFADKIPWVDSLWDTIHTLIRPLGAAILGATAIGSVNPVFMSTAILLCGGIALSSHSAKAGTRLLVNHSPEPFSNLGLSVVEDVSAVFGTWFVLNYPIATFVLVFLLLGLFIMLVPKLVGFFRREIPAAYALVKDRFSKSFKPS